MKVTYLLLAAGLLAVPAAAQPVIIPLTPQKQTEPPPPPPPSPVPVAPPQVGIPGSAQGTGAPAVRRDESGQAVQEQQGQGAARAPDPER